MKTTCGITRNYAQKIRILLASAAHHLRTIGCFLPNAARSQRVPVLHSEECKVCISGAKALASFKPNSNHQMPQEARTAGRINVIGGSYLDRSAIIF